MEGLINLSDEEGVEGDDQSDAVIHSPGVELEKTVKAVKWQNAPIEDSSSHSVPMPDRSVSDLEIPLLFLRSF